MIYSPDGLFIQRYYFQEPINVFNSVKLKTIKNRYIYPTSIIIFVIHSIAGLDKHQGKGRYLG